MLTSFSITTRARSFAGHSRALHFSMFSHTAQDKTRMQRPSEREKLFFTKNIVLAQTLTPIFLTIFHAELGRFQVGREAYPAPEWGLIQGLRPLSARVGAKLMSGARRQGRRAQGVYGAVSFVAGSSGRFSAFLSCHTLHTSPIPNTVVSQKVGR